MIVVSVIFFCLSVYFQVKAHKKDSERVHLNYQFIAWWLEKHQKKHPEEQIVVLFDMTDAGLSNVDIDLLKFQISCFTTYFPHILGEWTYSLLPWFYQTLGFQI